MGQEDDGSNGGYEMRHPLPDAAAMLALPPGQAIEVRFSAHRRIALLQLARQRGVKVRTRRHGDTMTVWKIYE